jgi:hypothetical protein
MVVTPRRDRRGIFLKSGVRLLSSTRRRHEARRRVVTRSGHAGFTTGSPRRRRPTASPKRLGDPEVADLQVCRLGVREDVAGIDANLTNGISCSL